MPRLARFLVLFGVGLLALVLALGPGRLFRGSNEPTIVPSDLGDLGDQRAPIEVDDPTQQGRGIGVALEGAGRLPHWKVTTLPDGSTRRVMDALIEYPQPGIEAFAGGFHVTRPTITLFPGVKPDEKPTARIRAGGADVATRGDASKALQLAGGSQSNELAESIREFTLSPGVVLEWLDEKGDVAFTLETERLEAPESTPSSSASGAGAMTELAPRLVAPSPVHFVRADKSLDLRAGGMQLDRAEGRLTLLPPIALSGTDLSLPGLGGETKTSATAAAVVSKKPPFFLTADGPATFVRKAARAKPAHAPLGMQSVMGPGELVLTKNVFVKQLDPERGEQWLRTDRAVLVLEEDAEGRLVTERFDAGVPDAPVVLGLLGGSGNAAALHWTPATPGDPAGGGLVLDGPFTAKDLVIGSGKEAKKLALSAKGRLITRELPADATLPARTEIELIDGAHAEMAGGLDADADRLIATLLPPKKVEGDAGGGANDGMQLLSVELFGKPATAQFGERGRARAQRIRLTEFPGVGGGHVAQLEGDARVDTERGFLEGEVIDITAPSDEKEPTVVTVPQLAAGEFQLPEGTGPFGAEPVAARSAGAVAVKQRLVLEPLGACALTSKGGALDVIGRCIYHVRADAAAALPTPTAPQADADLQTLACDELHLVPDLRRDAGGRQAAAPSAREEFDVRAAGDVVLDRHDPKSPLHVRASFATTERVGGGGRRLVLDGTPAQVTFGLPPKTAGETSPGEIEITSARIVQDLDTEEITAADERDQVRVRVPESLLGSLLPSVRASASASRIAPAPAGAEPAELRADHFVVTPKRELATPGERLMQGRLDAHGRVRVTRPSSDATVTCRDLALDLGRRGARLDGHAPQPGEPASAAIPIEIKQPVAGAPDHVESVTADWIEVRDGGRTVDVAPRAVFVLYLASKKGQLSKVELHASDAPRLEGSRLSFTGGVEFFLTTKDSKGVETEARARSERAELILNHALDEPGAEIQEIKALQRVRLDYGLVHAECAILTYDFVTEWMELKEGAQPCTLLHRDEKGEWRATSSFRRMLLKGAPATWPSGESIVHGLELVVEGRRVQ